MLLLSLLSPSAANKEKERGVLIVLTAGKTGVHLYLLLKGCCVQLFIVLSSLGSRNVLRVSPARRNH